MRTSARHRFKLPHHGIRYYGWLAAMVVAAGLAYGIAAALAPLLGWVATLPVGAG
ncbi:hypothetical protein [Cupriavidus malaysiensis]|uniref:hypothetical protein n=1 Tax=Cupriavidus malaysiensis TaxID=367825 RepID=UPI0012FF5FBB|nr:hypothetical protein [Cupriavidus malaysiensis]